MAIHEKMIEMEQELEVLSLREVHPSLINNMNRLSVYLPRFCLDVNSLKNDIERHSSFYQDIIRNQNESRSRSSLYLKLIPLC